MAYICNKGNHLFKSLPEIVHWTGFTFEKKIIPNTYTIGLLEIISKMLDPKPERRLSAADIWDETWKNDRQLTTTTKVK